MGYPRQNWSTHHCKRLCCYDQDHMDIVLCLHILFPLHNHHPGKQKHKFSKCMCNQINQISDYKYATLETMAQNSSTFNSMKKPVRSLIFYIFYTWAQNLRTPPQTPPPPPTHTHYHSPPTKKKRG